MRFQCKGGLWTYCGPGVVTLRSSDWVRTETGEWVEAEANLIRGTKPNLAKLTSARPIAPVGMTETSPPPPFPPAPCRT